MSQHVRVEESVRISRPPVEVWSAIADYGFDLRWRRGLQAMSPDPAGPAALGTKVHEVVHTSGRDYVADTVVIDFRDGVAYRFAGEGTIGQVRGGRAVRADQGDGAVFTYSIELLPRGGMRLLGPLLGPMVRSGLKRDLQTLKSLLEDAT